jgi:hypothetical protein
VLTVLATGCYTQNLSKSTKKILRGIGKHKGIECASCNFKAEPLTAEDSSKQLWQVATDKDLELLTDHVHPELRCYAFKGLAKRPNANVFPILLKHLTDHKHVVTIGGCLITEESVADYFMDVVGDHRRSILSDTQWTILDSILLFQKGITVRAKDMLLSKIAPKPENYDRIREIATKEKNPAAALALARYKKPGDIDIIKSLFDGRYTESYALRAAKEFHDTAFYPLLYTLFERKWQSSEHDYFGNMMLYQTLATYPCKATYELFKRTTEISDEDRYQTWCTYLLVALTKYPNELFTPLLSNIKLNQENQDFVKRELEYDW